MSKIIESDELTAYERWELPSVKDSKSPTANELETIQKQAYEEGFELGKKNGFEQKEEVIRKQLESLYSIISLLTEPLKDLDNEVVNQLAHLSITIAKQVVRRELHTDEGEIVGIVREAMTALPASSRKVILNINPEDAELVRNAFSLGQKEESEELRWKIVEDPMLSRGGCKISSENSSIDATVEGRLNRIINTLLGGERESDE